MVNMDLTHKQGDPEAREYIVWLVSLCRFAEAVSIGMLIPIFPIFLKELDTPWLDQLLAWLGHTHWRGVIACGGSG